MPNTLPVTFSAPIGANVAEAEADAVATIKAEAKAKPFVPCLATVAEAEAQGYTICTGTDTSGDWADMLDKVLNGNKSHMQVFWPMFKFMSREHKAGLYGPKNSQCEADCRQIAKRFGGTLMVADAPKGARSHKGQRYIIVACDTVPRVGDKGRILQGDKFRAAYTENVAAYRAANK